ncbi:MAG: hypothetical protein M0P66_06360 [Salinivirgaceae bacterium]|nr:hypothetical protein [Salinivirgaceae bacterium]
MHQNRRLFIFLILILYHSHGFATDGNKAQTLLNKAQSNLALMADDPEQAYTEAVKIRNEAILEKNIEAELCALKNICVYYEMKYDFKNMISTAEGMFNQASVYNQLVYQAMAKELLFRAYAFNNLNPLALEQLTKGLSIIEKANGADSLVIDTKSNLYVSLSNYYLMQNDNQNRLKYIKRSMQEHEKFTDAGYRMKMQYIDYANLATVFLEINDDSAGFYATRSLALDQNYGMDAIKFSNYVVLGNINQKQGNFSSAIQYYKIAEQISNFKNHLNVEALYLSFVEVYSILGDTSNIEKYRYKLGQLKLGISENKNQSLHKIIEDKDKIAQERTYLLWVMASVLFLAFAVFLTLMIKKTRVLESQEIISREYLSARLIEQNEQLIAKLVERFEKNDLAFMASFNETFPGFTEKLLTLNPKLVQTEIEFCALLKLNIPTKEIARIRNIEPRTVQNKKYLIRKKLNIPPEKDIYQWFSVF